MPHSRVSCGASDSSLQRHGYSSTAGLKLSLEGAARGLIQVGPKLAYTEEKEEGEEEETGGDKKERMRD